MLAGSFRDASLWYLSETACHGTKGILKGLGGQGRERKGPKSHIPCQRTPPPDWHLPQALRPKLPKPPGDTGLPSCLLHMEFGGPSYSTL